MSNRINVKQTLVLSLGMGSLHAWVFIVLMGRVLLPESITSPTGISIHWIFFLLASLATWSYFIVRPLGVDSVRILPILSLVQIFGSIAIISTNFFHTGHVLTYPILVAGSLLAGFGSAFQIICWSRHLYRCDAHTVSTSVTFSYAVGGFFALIIALLPDRNVVMSLILLFPVISALCSTSLHRQKKREETGNPTSKVFCPSAEDKTKTNDKLEDANRPDNSRKKILILIFGYGVVFGVLGGALQPFSADNSNVLTSLLTVVSSMMVYIIMIRKQRFASFGEQAVKSIAIMIAVGVVMAPFSESVTSALALSFVGIRLIDSLSWSILSKQEDFSNTLLEGTFPLGRVSINGGTLLGILIAMLVVEFLGPQQVPIGIVSCALLVVMMIVSAIGFNPSSKITRISEKEESSIESKKEASSLITSLVEDFGLDEDQVFLVDQLIAGRSAPYIADKIYISQSAVRARIRKLYKKLEISSRQELICLVRDSEE